MSDLLDFAGKIVLVAGGSTGIGNGIARAFRDHGASVIVTASQPFEQYDSDTAAYMTGYTIPVDGGSGL